MLRKQRNVQFRQPGFQASVQILIKL